MFDLEHYIEKPILGLNSEKKFSVAELTLPLAESIPIGGRSSSPPTTLAVAFIRSVETKFRKSNSGSIGASTETSVKFLEEFTNLVYHIETLEASSSGEVGDVHEFFVDQICFVMLLCCCKTKKHKHKKT